MAKRRGGKSMKVVIQILDDRDEPVWGHEGPLETPKDMKTPPDRPWRSGKYKVYGFVFQPVVKVVLGGE
jgi:hypothetical protein